MFPPPKGDRSWSRNPPRRRPPTPPGRSGASCANRWRWARNRSPPIRSPHRNAPHSPGPTGCPVAAQPGHAPHNPRRVARRDRARPPDGGCSRRRSRRRHPPRREHPHARRRRSGRRDRSPRWDGCRVADGRGDGERRGLRRRRAGDPSGPPRPGRAPWPVAAKVRRRGGARRIPPFRPGRR